MAVSQVIDLCLSSASVSPHERVSPRLPRPSKDRTDHILAQHDPFELSSDFGFPIPPSKRQKIDTDTLRKSPSPNAKPPTSFDPATRPSLQRTEVKPRTRYSRPPSIRLNSEQRDSIVEVLPSEQSADDVDFGSSPPGPRTTIDFSSKTTQLLAEISGNACRRTRKGQPITAATKSAGSRDASTAVDENRPSKPVPGRKAVLTAEQKEEARVQKAEDKQRKQLDREANATRKKAERQATAERKEAEKERRDAAKQVAAELAEANRARWDPKSSVAEMIVELPASAEGSKLEAEMQELLADRKLDIDITTHRSLLLPNVVRFRRKVTSRFNGELGYWEPVPMTIEVEKQALCLLSGLEFISMATASDAENEGLHAYMEMLRMKFADYRITVVIEGFEQALKESANAANRAFQASVRAQSRSQTGNHGTSRQQSAAAREQTAAKMEEQVEEALVELQIVHGCLVHLTEAKERSKTKDTGEEKTWSENAAFIASFTQQMSTIPYRLAFA